MENILNLNKIIKLEEKININLDLLEVAKIYCETKYDKSSEASTLLPMLEVILQNQKDTIAELDNLLAN